MGIRDSHLLVCLVASQKHHLFLGLSDGNLREQRERIKHVILTLEYSQSPKWGNAAGP